MTSALRSYSVAEVQKHNSPQDAWIIIDGFVYDVTTFAELHPGGRAFIYRNAGTDCTANFKLFHAPAVLRKYHDRLVVGKVRDFEEPSRMAVPGAFGDMIPFGDPIWYQRFNSPYYKETHVAFRQYVRTFVETEIVPTLDEWIDDKRPPQDILLKLGAAGLLPCMSGPPFPADYVDPAVIAKLPFKPEEFDFFHELILFDEICRAGGNAAVVAAITNGPAIALSAIMKFGTEAMKRRVAPEVYSGRKFIALAISEPSAGSDVANLQTVATASADGSHFIVNGNKKWITNGTYADYFVTAVNTEKGGGHKGMSMILIEHPAEGFSVRKVRIPGSDLSGTSYLDFSDVRVPATNLIGQRGAGFKMIMHNFNHERFYITVCCTRLSRVCLEESIKYAMRRSTFGKALHQHQAIRMKIAAMTRAIEQQQAWLEYVTYQLCTMSHAEAMLKLGDVICLLKVQASKTYELVARETTQIFGGNALMAGGPGHKIQYAVGQVKAYQIPGGAEDVMDDFAARTAFKMAAAMAKL